MNMSLEDEYKLSVVVLVYNTEGLLEECLDSLVNQTLDGIEIICVNDESKDNSLNILKRYERKYDNFKVINQKNAGGAIAGNNGLKMAKGEYVALMDSDDIVVLDAYEKLYNKAKETDSDIVSGRPFRYVDKYQRSFGSRNDMWDIERTIDIFRDVEIFYDVFYWNKIFRKKFVEENEIYMIPGKLYADAPLVFKAYLNAKKITVINDFVYYWRFRSINESITKSITDLKNTEDRLDNYYVLKEYFRNEPELFNQVIGLYFERFFYPIKAILDNPIFKEAYLKDLRKILIDIDDVLDNKYFNNIYELYAYLILNDKISILEDFLKNYEDVKDIIVEGNKSYWNLKYFRNPQYDIPDEIFEIKNLHRNFIDIYELCLKDNAFHMFLSLPPTLNFEKVRIRFNGLTKKYGSKDENSYLFDLNLIEDNKYNLNIPLERIDNINFYDVYLDVVYDGKREPFRLRKSNMLVDIDDEDLIEENKAQLVFTSLENLSLINTCVNNIFNLDCDDERFRIISNKNEINYRIGISHKKESETVYFNRLPIENTDRFTNVMELKWKYSLEKGFKYKMFIELTKERFDLTPNHFINFKNQEIDFNGGKIKIYAEKGCIYLIWV